MFPHTCPVEVNSLAVAWKEPLEVVVAEKGDGGGLLGPIVPANVSGSVERIPIAAPPEVIAAKQVSVLVEENAVAAGVARSGNCQEPRGELDRVKAVQNEFGIGLSGEFQTMDDTAAMETPGPECGVGQLFPRVGHKRWTENHYDNRTVKTAKMRVCPHAGATSPVLRREPSDPA